MALAINMMTDWEKALIYLCMACVGCLVLYSSVRLVRWSVEEYAAPLVSTLSAHLNGR